MEKKNNKKNYMVFTEIEKEEICLVTKANNPSPHSLNLQTFLENQAEFPGN